MMLQVLSLFVISWLPGAVIFRGPWLDRASRARLDAEERAFWSVLISICASLAIVLALAAAGRYSFQRLVIADLIVAGAAAAVARGRLRLDPGARRPGLTALVPIALVVLGGWRFFPPSEYVIGGKDPGVYMNAGIQIAQRGAIVVHDPVVASLPAFARDLFHPSHERTDYYSVRFMGFFIKDPAAGTVISQLQHLFPASIAIGYGIDGLTGARRTAGVWAILGLLAVYFMGVRLAGRTAAAAACVLLALNVVTVWFARYPNAEVVIQALLFAALLANARAHIDGDRFFAPLAAALLVLLLFLRYDNVLAWGGVAAGLTAACFIGIRPRRSFVVVLIAGAGLAGWYLLGPMRAYVHLPIVFLSHLRWWQYAMLAVFAAAGLWTSAGGARNARVSTAVERWLPLACGLLLCAAAGYALFFRHPAGKLVIHDAYALRTFAGFYATLPAVLAALAGYVLLGRDRFWKAPAFFLTVAIFSLFLFYKIRIVPDHFWLARRFVPIILPATLLLACAVPLSVGDGTSWRQRGVRIALGLVFISLLAWHYARASRPIAAHVEYAGLIPRLERLADTVGDDLLIVESRNASDAHVLALPLAYIYARNVLVLHSPLPDQATFAAFLDWARTKYRRVLFLGGGGTSLLSRRWAAIPIESARFQVPEYDAPLNAYPRFVRQKEFDYSIYALTPPTGEEAPWFELDVGTNDDLHVLRFHAKEPTAERTFRWTRDTSYVTVTALRPEHRVVTIWMHDGGRPAAAPSADVTVSLNDVPLGTARVQGPFRPYEIQIPAEVAAQAARLDTVRLRLRTTTWNPSKVLGTSDDRELGVMVDRVTVK